MSTTRRHSIDTWRCYITKHLGRSIRSKAHSLMVDILAVDVGIKPGYLYDIGEPNGDKITNLLRELNAAGFISCHCNVIQIGLDCIIVNVESMKDMKITVDCFNGKLVDVSYSRPSPCMYQGNIAKEQLYQIYLKILENLDDSNIQKYTVPEPDCNVSSLFGLLLGYPVLYWYDTCDDCHGNCLSMETLTCAKLNVQFVGDCDVKHCLYSFSYPMCVGHTILNTVDKWLLSIQERINHSQIFTQPRFIQENKTLEVVNL